MKILLSLLVALAGLNSAYAGGCNLEEVTPTQALSSLHLANEVRNKVLQVEADMAAQGEKLEVVMVATPSARMKNMDLVKDDLSKDLQTYMLELARISRMDHSERRGKLPRLPKKYYDKDNALEFSHFGFLVRNSHENPEANTWTTVYHLLAQCDKSKNRYGMSDILYEPFHEFFWNSDLMKSKGKKFGIFGKRQKYINGKTLLVVPSVKIQPRLIELFKTAGRPGDPLHEPRYNVIATPYKLQSLKDAMDGKRPPAIHQLTDMNSNQWLLEVIAAAQKPAGVIRTRQQAQSQLWATNYHPSILRPIKFVEFNACGIKRGPFGIWDATNILQCTDQVFKPEMMVQIITARSMVKYMDKINLLAREKNGKARVYKIYADHNVLDGIQPLDKSRTKKDRDGNRYKVGPDKEDIMRAQRAMADAGLGGDTQAIFLQLLLQPEIEYIKRTSARRR